MLSAQITQIIDQDIKILNQQDGIQGKIGKLLGHGTYGFVCEWNDRSGIPKVVKVRDPEYIQKKNDLSHSQTDTLLMTSVMPVLMEKLVANEQIATEKIAHTKHQNLMTILSGTQYAQLDDRDVLLMVMPRMQTIQDLPISEKREQQIAEILCDCCDGLHVLHREPQEIAGQKVGLDSMIHGDLKPDNIFVHSQQSGSSVTTWYVVGDYSSCMWLGQLQKYPQLAYPNEQGLNPYCAPGTIGVTSDIWSLGWILWYWMNGKVHPTQEDIRTRRKPDNWGDNPELWDVFLKMTDPTPSKRYQNVDVVRSELMRAMENRQARLAQDQSDFDILAGAAISAGVYLVYKLVSALFSSKTDSHGEFHGNIRKDIDYLGGKFRGEWSHGMPVRGTFTYNGVKKSGRWVVKENYQIPFSDFGTMTFSGLINNDQGENFYQGNAHITWEHGTKLVCPIINGEFSEGTMTFANGQKRKTGLWKEAISERCSNIICEDASGFYSCGVYPFAEDTFYEGALWQAFPEGGDIVLPNRRIPFKNSEAFITAWELLIQMQRLGGSFYGSWDADGHPTQGAYTFSTGQTVQSKAWSTGNFTLPSGHVLEGTFCDLSYGPSGVGKLTFMPSEVVFEGEFLHNATGNGVFYDRFGNCITKAQAEAILRQW